MEVGIRLLAQHLMLDSYNTAYLSKASYIRLKQITPPGIYKLVVKDVNKVTQPETNKPAITPLLKKPEPRPGQASYHTVRPGETLYRIAKKYDLTLDELRALNDISGNEIENGQVLKVNPYNIENESNETDNDSTGALSDTLRRQDTFSFSKLDSSGPRHSAEFEPQLQ